MSLLPPSPIGALQYIFDMIEGIFVQGSGQRIISGRVTAAGGVVAPVGEFTVAHPAAGKYDITYSTPFSAPPRVVAMPEGSGPYGAKRDTTFTASVVRINIKNMNTNVDVDLDFDFIAVGPR